MYLTLKTAKPPRYYTFTAARSVIGFAIAGIESACFVLVMELVGPSKRTQAGIVCWDGIDCGILVLVPILGLVQILGLMYYFIT